MKRILTIPLSLYIAFVAFTSCESPAPESGEDPFEYVSPWQRELKTYIVDGAFGPDLKLLNYKYLMTVENESDIEALYDEIFDPEALTPAYRDSVFDSKKFTMEPYSEYEKNGNGGLFQGDRQYVDSLLRTYPKIAELEWDYQSVKFKTKAILDNGTNRIAYDHVISHLIIFQKTVSRAITKTIPQSQELLECEKIYKVSTIFKKKEVYAQVVVSISGYFEDGRKCITGRSVSPSSYNGGFSEWTAIAQARILDYYPGVNGRLSASYGCGIAPTSSLMGISFNESSQKYVITNAYQSICDTVLLFPSSMIDISNQ